VTADASRVVLIGLDCADWRILTPHLERGAMPNLAAIVERGKSGRLAAPPMAHMDVAWACALTGMHAHDHGLLDPEVPSDDGRAVRPSSAADRRAPVVWEVAQRAGTACVAIGWGEALGDCGEPDGRSAADVTPAPCAGADGAMPQIDAKLDPRDRGLRDRLHDLLCESERIAHHAMDRMRSVAWRFAAVRFGAFGTILNDYVRFIKPAPSWVLPRRAASFEHAIDEACRLHDQWIGEIIRLAPSERTAVMIASPRGTPMELLRTDPASPERQPSRPAGIVAVCGAGVERDALAFGMAAIDVCPAVLALLGCEWPGRGSRTAGNDWWHAARAHLTEDAMAIAVRRDCALAESLADAGRCEEAAQVMQRLVDAGRADGRMALRHVAILRDAGRIDAARAALGACGDVPTELREWRALLEASLHAAQERHLDALNVLQCEQRRQERAGDADTGAALHIACARSQLALGRLGDAERSCGLALKSDPDHRGAHVMHAQVLYALERYSESIDAGRRALALAHFDPQVHLLVGTALAALGHAPEAVAQLKIAVEQDPGLVAAYRRLAAVHLRQLGDVNAARAYAARAAEARAALERVHDTG